MKRLFAALKITPDEDFLKKYRQLQVSMSQQRIKWVEEHNIHITLKFFGETEERKIPLIGEILRERAAATQLPPLKLAGLGIFGSRHDPRVVWTGIEPGGPLVDLMGLLREDLRKAGCEPDRQNLVPHLTLGRIREVRDRILFDRAIGQYFGIESVPQVMHQVTLFESILHRTGPEYLTVGEYPLKLIG